MFMEGYLQKLHFSESELPSPLSINFCHPLDEGHSVLLRGEEGSISSISPQKLMNRMNQILRKDHNIPVLTKDKHSRIKPSQFQKAYSLLHALLAMQDSEDGKTNIRNKINALMLIGDFSNKGLLQKNRKI